MSNNSRIIKWIRTDRGKKCPKSWKLYPFLKSWTFYWTFSAWTQPGWSNKRSDFLRVGIKSWTFSSYPSQPGLRLRQLARSQASEGGTDVRMYGRTDGRMYVGKISSFYRTLSPIGATDLLPKGRSRPIKKSRARVLLTTWCLWATG